jgi:hypothetical protein
MPMSFLPYYGVIIALERSLRTVVTVGCEVPRKVSLVVNVDSRQHVTESSAVQSLLVCCNPADIKNLLIRACQFYPGNSPLLKSN